MNINQFKDINIQKITLALKDTPYLHGCVAAYLMAKHGDSVDCLSNEGVPFDIINYAIQNENEIKTALKLISNFTAEECGAYLLFSEDNRSRGAQDNTPSCLSKLAARLLDNSSDMSVYCCGTGDFLLESNIQSGISCYDTNSDRILIAMMRCDFSGISADIVNVDVLNVTKKENRIFIDIPFGMRVKDFESNVAIQSMKEQIPDVKVACSADWLFLWRVISNLEMSGKAVAMISCGACTNRTDTAIRKYFVDNGLIETVILLPAKLYASTMIPCIMAVLSRENKTVNFVDASNMFIKGRRTNDMSEEQISKIISACGNDTEISKKISVNEIAEHDYQLNAIEFLKKCTSLSGAVQLGTLIKKITRGTQIKADELDEISSTVPTNSRFVRISDIQDGMLSDDLPYITEISKKYARYIAPYGSLIMTKNGKPIKIAVVDNQKENILVNGNMYVLLLDEEKVNPYYLKAYLESRNGNESLNGLMVGVTIPAIPLESLKKLEIPLLPMEVQNKIAEKYIECLKKIKHLKKQLEIENSKRLNVFEDYVNEG